ncbi:hypothetical protein DPMN_054140 [Dreissena polymorpha]|uniref:Uncharacterized protein n=1 Tax=Dreissena polymorpha TaxID=45954 RepID=A0A9D4CNY5_DREPO|nr:hypothetical protein DPMN_054140 [Dreissena polymorpha]
MVPLIVPAFPYAMSQVICGVMRSDKYPANGIPMTCSTLMLSRIINKLTWLASPGTAGTELAGFGDSRDSRTGAAV